MATVDGRSATGTENRNEILRKALEGRGTAIQAEQFLDLNTKSEGRALMREHDVIYIFQDVIDKVGDATATEAKTVDAAEQDFGELVQIVKKVANINGTTMLLVSDHGFLFQLDPVDGGDETSFPAADTGIPIYDLDAGPFVNGPRLADYLMGRPPEPGGIVDRACPKNCSSNGVNYGNLRMFYIG